MNRTMLLKDRHGNDLHIGNAGDIWLFPDPEIEDFRQHLKNARQLKFKDNDVILASFNRSGTFWHHQILQMLMENTTEYLGRLYDDHLEWCPYEKLRKTDSPRTYVTHMSRFRLLPPQVKEKKTKIIYCYRNPKDVWVSFYNVVHGMKLCPSYEGTWSHFYDLMIDGGLYFGDWFDHVLDWEQAATEYPDRFHFSCYELMKKDPVGQILKLDQFLGLNRGRQLCEQIADACQFTKLKTVEEARDPQFHGETAWKKGSPGFYRKGEIGDWKNWFTVAQSEQLDAVFEKRMSGSKLPFFFQ